MKKLFWLLAFLACLGSARAQFSGQRVYVGSSSGTANAQTLAVANYGRNVGVQIFALMSLTNTGALTLNVNGTGVTNVKKVTPNGLQALTGGEVVAHQISQFIFDGSFYELLGGSASAFGTQQSLASATTTDLGTALSNSVLVTGTTTIASFGSSASLGNPYYLVQFQSSLSITYNVTSMIIPGAASLTVQANDTILAQYLGPTNWRIVSYFAAGSCANPFPTTTTVGDIATFSNTVGCLQDSAVNIAAGALTGLTTPLSSAQGGSGVASPTVNTIPINEGASAQHNTGAGTLGQALVSQGSGSDPAWTTGVRTLLNTLTASNSATLTDITHFTSSYSEYDVIWENLVPATTSTTCDLQVHSGGSYQATTYLSQTIYGTATTAAATAPTTFIPCSAAGVTNAAPGVSGSLHVSNPSQTSAPKQWFGSALQNGAAMGALGGYWNGGNGAVDGFQVLFSSGNITSGVIKIYGYN